ncbi:MAG: threonine synthase [Pseudomonadota bacterium]
MKYLSTRGGVGAAKFDDVLLTGLAGDGGLFMPETWPQVSPSEIAEFRGEPYADVAASIMARFTGDAFSHDHLLEITRKVYGAFDHADVAPLTQIGDEDWILELFHGPTLAFKDFAMQALGAMFDDLLERRGERLTIICATSGDTGAAAIEALKSCKRVDIVVLHPEGRVSDVQRRMMTCVANENVCNIAVDGSFDDCQSIVKALFADEGFVARTNLGGVNSINWARLAAQIVYYFTASAAISDGEPISFVVPTGNFGDVFAGYAAKRMGLPIAKLAVATNANDILHRAIQHGDYSPAGVAATSSPSMDIQVASNFERLLYEVLGRDSDALRMRMTEFQKTGVMALSDDERRAIGNNFVSYAASETDTIAEIKRHYQEHDALIDPHTAVARVAAQRLRDAKELSGKVVTLSTAHPAKFPDVVERAAGAHPALPSRYRDLFDRPEHMATSPATTEAVKALMLDRLGGRAQS